MIATKIYRLLADDEIARLEAQGCRCNDWAAVEVVAEGFTTRGISNVRFCGELRLGADVCIEDVGRIISTDGGTFGIGVRAAVLNENSGRKVFLHERLTAQTAYIMCMYRHRPRAIETLERMAVEGAVHQKMTIGDGVRVTGCGTLRDVQIGEGAVLDGVAELANGTVGCGARVGVSVVARDFIFASGASVCDGAQLTRCFVGDGARIESAFTAVDSLFFANSHCANGEAASVFAGPYTVSHHRSTLLIAGYFLFFNAGSNSNQSNHHFRTGPVHQGIHERGVKFGSGAYIMLPAREGAFSVVVGSHRSHHDTADFPYSYLIEEEGDSYLVPGANLISHGMMRDMAKWPQRDRRSTDREGGDIINFREWTPCIGQKLRRAIARSEKMLAREDVQMFNYERVRIRRSMLRRGLGLYRQALDAVIAAALAESSGDALAESDPEWADLAGMFAPRCEIERLLDEIEKGELANFEAVIARLHLFDSEYAVNARAWALAVLAGKLGRRPTADDIAHAIEAGHAARAAIDAARTSNARQDADPMMAVGYGIDAASPAERSADFLAVRGVEIL